MAEVVYVTRAEWEVDLSGVNVEVKRRFASERWARFNAHLHGVGPKTSLLGGCVVTPAEELAWDLDCH